MSDLCYVVGCTKKEKIGFIYCTYHVNEIRKPGGKANMETYTMDRIKTLNKAAGKFYFSKDTMKFFDSKIPKKVYQGRGGVFFIMENKRCFDDQGRAWRVVQFDLDNYSMISGPEFYDEHEAQKEAEYARLNGFRE